MEKFFTVGEAAARAGVTAETLRHYDRIGLVVPSATDPWTKYRRYTEEDIIRVRTVSALRSMGFSLKEIGLLMGTEDIGVLIGGFERALRQADEKIAALEEAKRRIGRVKAHYESKRLELPQGISLRKFSPRAILLSKLPLAPTVETLHDYHRHFYAQLGERRALYSFEDTAGILEEAGKSTMFAVCTRHPADGEVRTLPGGEYLSAGCTEESREKTRTALLARLRARGAGEPPFSLCLIRLTGLLSWEYEWQLPVLMCAQPAGAE